MECCAHDANSSKELTNQDRVPYVDLRKLDEFIKHHIKGSCSIPWNEIEERLYELPPKNSSINVVCNVDLKEKVDPFFKDHDYIVIETLVDDKSEKFWDDLKGSHQIESGSHSQRLWKPSPYLEEVIDEIENTLKTTRNSENINFSALDIACGSGRDAVFLSQRGWQVSAVDYLQNLLDNAQLLASRYGCKLATLCVDLEKPTTTKTAPQLVSQSSASSDQLLESVLPKVDLIHVARYLHRPLFPVLSNLVNPGGFIVYHTFMKGVEVFGKPKNPRFILEPNELKTAFQGFEVVHYRETTLEDGRPIQIVVSRKSK